MFVGREVMVELVQNARHALNTSADGVGMDGVADVGGGTNGGWAGGGAVAQVDEDG